MNVREAARRYILSGLSVIPIRTDGSKSPAIVEWTSLQDHRLDIDRIDRLFGDDVGIGILGGEVSGMLEILDFDKEGIFEQWAEVVGRLAPKLLDGLPLVETPSRGHHLYYRCKVITGNTKLARAAQPFVDITGKTKSELIESKGEGGYVVAPPSPPSCHAAGTEYRHVAGPPLTQIPEISIRQRALLFEVARSFHEQAGSEHRPPSTASVSTGRPGDAYADQTSWADILDPHGWEMIYSRGDVCYWRRPGKTDKGISATTGHCEDKLYVFSTNAHPFDSDRTFGKFAAYCLLNHGGDFLAAANELRRAGFGARPQQPPPPGTHTEPPRADHAPAAPEQTPADELLVGVSLFDAFEAWRDSEADAIIPTGIASLDNRISGGLPVGHVTTLVGYTGVGKSELARQIRRSAAANGIGVLQVDMELGAKRILERDLAQISEVPSALLRRKELTDGQWDAAHTAGQELREMPVRIIDPHGPPPLALLGQSIKAELAKLPSGSCLIVLDSLQKLALGVNHDSPRIQVQRFMVWAGSIAREFGAAVLLTSEQKRSSDGRKPSVGDMLTSGAESRAIEFGSDVFLGLFPVNGEDPDDDEGDDYGEGGVYQDFERPMELFVAKVRDGRVGRVRERLIFTGPCWGMKTERLATNLTDQILEVLCDPSDLLSATVVAKRLRKRKQLVVAEMRRMTAGNQLEWIDHGSKERGYRLNPKSMTYGMPSVPESGTGKQMGTSSGPGNRLPFPEPVDRHPNDPEDLA